MGKIRELSNKYIPPKTGEMATYNKWFRIGANAVLDEIEEILSDKRISVGDREIIKEKIKELKRE